MKLIVFIFPPMHPLFSSSSFFFFFNDSLFFASIGASVSLGFGVLSLVACSSVDLSSSDSSGFVFKCLQFEQMKAGEGEGKKKERVVRLEQRARRKKEREREYRGCRFGWLERRHFQSCISHSGGTPVRPRRQSRNQRSCQRRGEKLQMREKKKE
jgi:hypothetical protein